MEEEKRETPAQFTQSAKPEPIATMEKAAPKVGRKISFDKFWFIPVILALVAIMVIGGLWIMNKGLLAPKPSPTPTASPSAELDEDTAALEEQGTSDEISEIEADLNATDLSDIDQELTDIESELSSP